MPRLDAILLYTLIEQMIHKCDIHHQTSQMCTMIRRPDVPHFESLCTVMVCVCPCLLSLDAAPYLGAVTIQVTL